MGALRELAGYDTALTLRMIPHLKAKTRATVCPMRCRVIDTCANTLVNGCRHGSFIIIRAYPRKIGS